MKKINDFYIAENLSNVLKGNVTFTLDNGTVMVNYPDAESPLSLDDFFEEYKSALRAIIVNNLLEE